MNYKKISLLLSVTLSILLILTFSISAEDKVFEGEELNIYPTLTSYKNVTGNEIKGFKESSMLSEKVNEGELPEVEERLPEEPVVIDPREEIGQYGGRIKGVSVVEGNTGDLFYSNMQYLLKLGPDFRTVIPNIAKDWELYDDFTTLEVNLREGMKWSDGEPFTTEDIEFWYEGVLLNEELSPVIPDAFKKGGEIVELEVVDDYTFKFIYADSVPFIKDALALESSYEGFFVTPKHYMKQFHIDYNEDANQLAEEEGYDEWWELFEFNVNSGNEQQNTELPTLYPWVLDEIDDFGNKYYVRNPYYWKIDTEGNQLPYIDEQMVEIVGDPEVKRMKTISGELDVGGIWQDIADYPLYKENTEEGNYHAMRWTDPRANINYSIGFNYTHEDEVLREIFNDIRFRKAMSLAIDREEINEQLFFGVAKTRQPTVSPDSRFHEEWQEDYYTEYDPEKANKLLDEMGLKWDENQEYRLRPDGEELSLTWQFIDRHGPGIEIIKDHWEDVGIEVHTRQVTRERQATLKEGNDVDIGNHGFNLGPEFSMRQNSAVSLLPPWSTGVGYPWQTWYETDGEEGEEPPPEIKELYETRDKWVLTEVGSEEYLELGQKLVNKNIENLFNIGVIGLAPYPVNISRDLGNIPGEENSLWFPGWLQWQPYPMEQWYFK